MIIIYAFKINSKLFCIYLSVRVKYCSGALFCVLSFSLSCCYWCVLSGLVIASLENMELVGLENINYTIEKPM